MQSNSICEFHVRGFCKFGTQCRNIHPRMTNASHFDDPSINLSYRPHYQHRPRIFHSQRPYNQNRELDIRRQQSKNTRVRDQRQYKSSKCEDTPIILAQNTKECGITQEVFEDNRLVGYESKILQFPILSINSVYQLCIFNENDEKIVNYLCARDNVFHLAEDAIDKIPNRGAYFRFMSFMVENLLYIVRINLFTKNGNDFYHAPTCVGRPIHFITLIKNNRMFINKSTEMKKPMDILIMIFKEIYLNDFILLKTAFEKMIVPSEILNIIKTFYYGPIGLEINVSQ